MTELLEFNVAEELLDLSSLELLESFPALELEESPALLLDSSYEEEDVPFSDDEDSSFEEEDVPFSDDEDISFEDEEVSFEDEDVASEEEEVTSEEEDSPEESEDTEALREFARSLSGRLADVYQMLLIKTDAGADQPCWYELADKWGVSAAQITKDQKKIIRMIREYSGTERRFSYDRD